MRLLLAKQNKKGFVNLIVGILIGFMAVTMFIALIPGFVEIINYGKSAAGLNCPGYVDNTGGTINLSYNASIGSQSSIGCMAMNLYIPYLVLMVLIAIVVKILYDKSSLGASPY